MQRLVEIEPAGFAEARLRLSALVLRNTCDRRIRDRQEFVGAWYGNDEHLLVSWEHGSTGVAHVHSLCLTHGCTGVWFGVFLPGFGHKVKEVFGPYFA